MRFSNTARVVSLLLVVALITAMSTSAWAQSGRRALGSGESGGGYVSQTQAKRSAERFNILDWITQQRKAKAEQDMKYGSVSKGLWFTPDLALTYRQSNAKISRSSGDFAELATSFGRAQLLLNNFISTSNKTRSINVDLGVEGYFGNTHSTKFLDTNNGTDWSYREQGGALLFRPFGRSSQDTGVIIKAGYLDVQQRGFWDGLNREINLNAIFVGAEAKLYLLNFLGARLEYQTTFDRELSQASGKWSMSRLYYSAFVELWLLGLELYLQQTNWNFTPDSGNSVRDREVSVGAAASLFF